MVARDEVIHRHWQLCLPDRLTPAERKELGELNARIAHEGEDGMTLCVDGIPWDASAVDCLAHLGQKAG